MSAGYRLQFRFQTVLQISEKERGAPPLREQHVPDVAGTDDRGQLLRPDTRPVRPETVPGPVAQLPRRLSQKRHLLLPDRAEDRSEVQTRSDRRQTAERPQDSHQGPSDQLRSEPTHSQVRV